MTNTHLPVSIENNHLEPFEDRIDTLFREIELATKWQRPSVLWAIYNSEYVRSDADIALENRLLNLGQRTHHIKIENQNGADISVQISKLVNLDHSVIFVEGLRWGAGQAGNNVYHALNNRLEFFVDHQVRLVFWLTEREAIDLAHFSPEYWSARHRVIEFVDSPTTDQISPHILESAWQGTGEFTDPKEDLDAKIALRTALLTDLPTGSESTAVRANLLLTLGMLHWRRGDYEKSTLFLNTALDDAAMLEDDYFEALCFNALALVQTDQGRLEEAIQAYQNAIRLAPDQISPWNNLGQLYRKLGRYAEALAAFQKAIEHDGSDAVGWNGLGDLYHETGKIDEAVHAYLKAIEFSPDYAHPWCGMGNVHLAEGRLDEALHAHRKAIEIDCHTIKSWLGLGEIYRMQGDKNNASLAYRTALELDPRNERGWNALGNLYYEAAEYEEALSSYQKCIELEDGSCQTYCKLASIYILKDLHAEAVPLLLKALELSEDGEINAHLWNQLGDAYRRIDQYDEAMEAYRKADALKLETASTQAGLSGSESYVQAPSVENASQYPESIPEPVAAELDLPDPEASNACEEGALGPEVYKPDKEEHHTPEASNSCKEGALNSEASRPIKEEPLDPQAPRPDKQEHLEPEGSTSDQEQFLPLEVSNSEQEEPLDPEASNPTPVGPMDNSSIQNNKENPSIKPEAEFLAWLDELATEQPAPLQAEIPDPALPDSIGSNTSETAAAPRPEEVSQLDDSGKTIPPVEVETSDTCKPSTGPSEHQILPDLPSKQQPAMSVPDHPVYSIENLPAADPAPAPIDPANTKEQEKSIIGEAPTQKSHEENEDSRQAQVTINEKNAQIWNELGNIYYNTGAFDEAMHAFEMATELDPYYGWSYYNLASIYIHFKRYSDAIPLYEKGLQLLEDQKDKAVLWNRLGDAYRRLNKHDQAVAAYRNAIELDPENVSLMTRARFSLLGNLRV
jgi:tetratricopeptide (TPR) repeat protein